MHNFFASSPENIKQMLRILSYLSECLSSGVFHLFEKLPLTVRKESSLLASPSLKHYASTPCWNLLNYVRGNPQLYSDLEKPIGIYIRGQAIELVFDKYVSTDFKLFDQELVKLSELVGSLVLGKGFKSHSPITAILKIIECSETSTARMLGNVLGLYQIAEGFFIGPKSVKKNHIPGQVFDFLYEGWTDIYLACSEIVMSRNSAREYPTSEILPSLIMISLCAAELHSISFLIPQVITQMHIADTTMPMLFRNFFKKEPIVKHWLFFSDESILEITSEFTNVMKSLGTDPKNEVAIAFWKIYGAIFFSRINELSEQLVGNVHRLLHNIETLLGRKNPPH